MEVTREDVHEWQLVDKACEKVSRVLADGA